MRGNNQFSKALAKQVKHIEKFNWFFVPADKEGKPPLFFKQSLKQERNIVRVA
jgi:hypothetical protein